MSTSIVPQNGDNKPMTFKFGDVDVRAVKNKNGEPLFVAIDICRILQIQNPTAALSAIWRHEKMLIDIETTRGIQEAWVLTEIGLYQMVVRSRTENAQIVADRTIDILVHPRKFTFEELFADLTIDKEKAEYYRAKRKMEKAKRRALIRSTHEPYSPNDIVKMYHRQKERCYYCNCKLDDTYTIDHVIPIARGGIDALRNLVIACPHCNSSKNDKLPHEWIKGGKLI